MLGQVFSTSNRISVRASGGIPERNATLSLSALVLTAGEPRELFQPYEPRKAVSQIKGYDRGEGWYPAVAGRVIVVNRIDDGALNDFVAI